MKQAALKLGVITCILVLCFGVVAGCSNAASNTDSTQQANRSYMSKMNSIMEQLGENLDSFVDAVSRGDLVNMRTQADNAYRSFDDMSALEVPDDLKDVHQSYIDGTAKLREALNAYIDLYTSAESGTLDQSTYASKLSNVQSLYDEGVEILKKADETAASK